jgi:hypothetical protein
MSSDMAKPHTKPKEPKEVKPEIIEFEPKSETNCSFISKDKKKLFRVHSTLLATQSSVFRELVWEKNNPIELDADHNVASGFFWKLYHSGPIVELYIHQWIAVAELLFRYGIISNVELTLMDFVNDNTPFSELADLAAVANSCNLEILLTHILHKVEEFSMLDDFNERSKME